jgi:hypothetical protein
LVKSTINPAIKAEIYDPFHTTTLNEIIKPLMAADKLKVLRRPNENYDILLYESDLKPHISKEKK